MLLEQEDGRWRAIDPVPPEISEPLSSRLAAKCWLLVREDRTGRPVWRWSIEVSAEVR